MYLKIKNKKIEIEEYSKKLDKFKSLRFVLNPIDYGIKLINKKKATTYFFFQRVDICFTDKDDVVLYLYENVRTERRIIKFKAFNIYYLPLGTCKDLKVGEKLSIKK